jgi:hypothetical protein
MGSTFNLTAAFKNTIMLVHKLLPCTRRLLPGGAVIEPTGRLAVPFFLRDDVPAGSI